ncbi:N-terminal glutamine amidase-domain-containing protein [Flammula alnicola]|nr:N-terminal glutamine amidase-domain-containing protein [Flammula alnicola]
MMPPPLPPKSIYTSCYCEENVYLLCQSFLQDPSLKDEWDVFVVFISNLNKTVALWCQKAARFHGSPVIWDYHVVLVLHPRREDSDMKARPSEHHSWVYDFDTRLDLPCLWEEYFSMTFPEDISLPYVRYGFHARSKILLRV